MWLLQRLTQHFLEVPTPNGANLDVYASFFYPHGHIFDLFAVGHSGGAFFFSSYIWVAPSAV